MEHDATEKQKERVFTLRRDLYLKKRPKTTVYANAYFGGMAQVDVTKPGYDAPLRDLSVAAQMQLVVSQSTAQLISDLVSYYGELQMKLIPKVGPISVLRSNIETITALYDTSQVEVQRVIAAMRQFNETGQRNADAFQRLTRSADVARQTSRATRTERTRLWGEVNARTIQFLRDLMPEIKEIAAANAPNGGVAS